MGQASAKLCTECLMPLYKRISTVESQPIDLEPMMLESTPKSANQDPFFSLEYLGIQETQETNDNSIESNLTLDLMHNAKEEFLSYISDSLADGNCEEMIKTDECLVYGKDLPDGFLLKAEWLIPYTGQEFIDFFQNIQERPKWDTNVAEIKLISQIKENLSTTYTKFKKVLTISARDLVLANMVYEVKEGILLVSKSVENSEVPEVDGCIRMVINLGGYLVMPVTETQGGMKSKVFSITKGDFGGSLPKKMIRKATAMALPKLNKAILKAMNKKMEIL